MAQNSLTLDQQKELLFKISEFQEAIEWLITDHHCLEDFRLMNNFLRLLLRAFFDSVEPFNFIVDCGGDASIFDKPVRTDLRTCGCART